MQNRGFTVLEMLIVLGGMAILLGAILTGLNLSKDQALAEAQVGKLKDIELALDQYKQACGEYPDELAIGTNNGCPNPSAGFIRFGDFMPNPPIVGAGGEVLYVGLASKSDTSESPACIYYHLAVKIADKKSHQLDKDRDFRTDRPSYLSENNLNLCNSSMTPSGDGIRGNNDVKSGIYDVTNFPDL